MGFLDRFDLTPRDRRRVAHARPLVFFLGEFFRLAGGIALVSAVFDVLLAAFSTAPAARLQFIVLWSALMAGFNLIVSRALFARELRGARS